MKILFIVCWFTLFALSFAGCDTAETPKNSQAHPGGQELAVNSVLPEDSSLVAKYSVDFEGDGKDEILVHYKDFDYDYISVFQNNGGWKGVFEREYPNKELEVDPDPGSTEIRMREVVEPVFIHKIELVDFGIDNKGEVMISFQDGLRPQFLDNYILIGFDGTEIKELAIPNGEDKFGDALINLYAHLMDVDERDGAIVEKWGELCEGGDNPCLTFEFVMTADKNDGTWKISKAQNIKKVEDEWNAYQERYNDAGEWTGELSF